MKKRILSLLLAGCMCLGLAACGQSGDDNSNAGNEDNSAVTDSVDESGEETQPSGKVTVYMPSPAGLADKLAAAFTEKALPRWAISSRLPTK